jgi:hypothetical protein
VFLKAFYPSGVSPPYLGFLLGVGGGYTVFSSNSGGEMTLLNTLIYEIFPIKYLDLEKELYPILTFYVH